MILKTKRLYDGHFALDQITNESETKKWEVLTRPDGVASVVYNTIEDKYVFVNQWRAGIKSELLEIVAGTLDKEGEPTESAIIREIEEETGYSVDGCWPIAECFVSPGCSTEKIYIYYSEVSQKISKGGGIDDEDIEIIEMGFSEMLATEFFDAKTIIGINFIKNKKVI